VQSSAISSRITTLTTVFASCLLLLVLVFATSSTMIRQSFRDLEEQSARRDMERAINALDDEIETLSRTNHDYAAWDDSYAFVAGKLPEYIASNLSDETFASNRLSLVIFVNTNHTVVFAKAFDLNTSQAEPVPALLGILAPPSNMLLDLPNLNSAHSGVLMLPQGPMLISARPILTSMSIGPAHGTLILGRKLDEQMIAEMAETTRLTLTSQRLDTGTLPPLVAELRARITAQQPTVVYPLNDKQMLTAEVHNDITGQPAFLLQISDARDVFSRGQLAIRYFGLSLLFVGLLLSTIGAVLLDRFILRLHASDVRFRRLVDTMPEPIIVHDGTMIHFCNPAGATLLGGVPLDACVGMQLTQFAPHPSDLAPINDDQYTQQWREDQFVQQHGELINVEHLAVPLQHEHNEMTLLIVRDITIRKQTEMALQTAKLLAEEANQSKSAFLAMMSHELRTPLTAILGFTELLQMQVGQAGYTDLTSDIEHIWTSGQHLLTLINNVLDISKIEAGKAVLHIDNVSLRDLIDTVVSTTKPLFAKNGNRFTLVAADTLGIMQTDAMKVRQVLLNLMSNAAKFTQDGTIVLRVEQEQRADGQWVRFSLSDTGIGIRADQVERLFQPFTQADTSTTRRYGGTGLGLALCKQLCVLLDGQIIVESTPNVGSTFIVTLPMSMVNRPGVVAPFDQDI